MSEIVALYLTLETRIMNFYTLANAHKMQFLTLYVIDD